MPTVLRIGALYAAVYPNDHRLAHVHVIGHGHQAVFTPNEPAGSVAVRENDGFSVRDLVRIQDILEENPAALLRAKGGLWMKPTIYLRIASVLTFVHSVLHTIGGVFGAPPPGPGEAAAEAMRSNHFLFMGVTRSYWEFHRGLGLTVTIFLTAEAIVFWQLGSLARTDATRLRPIMATFMVGYLAFAVNSYIYFFPVPIVFEFLIALCLGLAILGSKPAANA